MVNDAQTMVTGVTAAFSLNILHRLNRELGAAFDPANFRHRTLWNWDTLQWNAEQEDAE
jgi:uncharacterized SAM-dependent methyltransferase